jgi:protein phosphatase
MPIYEIKPAGLTDIGNVRAVNEDHLLVEGDVFVVADGMGGHRGGRVASRIAVETIREAFAADPTVTGLGAAVREANRAVWDRSRSDPALAGMGTTVAAVALVSETVGGGDRASLAGANVGDSRIYLLRDGALTLLSHDHSVVADLVRAGKLAEDQIDHHPKRNVLTRAVGTEPEVEPHLIETEPAPGDRVLLCSDGLFTEVPPSDITAVLLAEAHPAVAAVRLVGAAKANGGNDNVTAVVLDIARSDPADN